MAVTLHSYTKTEYKDAPAHKTTPLSAANLNNSEDGIDNAYTDIAAVYSELTTEDAKRALKSDLTSISETGSTASQAISAGTFFYLEGTLVRAKVDIANGATFTLNTNYEVVNGSLNVSISHADIALSGSAKIRFYKKDRFCWFNSIGTGATISHGNYYEIPSGYVPQELISGEVSLLAFAGVGAGTGENKIPFTAIITLANSKYYMYFYINGGAGYSVGNIIGLNGCYSV